MPRKKQPPTPAPSSLLPVRPEIELEPKHPYKLRPKGIFELAEIFSPLIFEAYYNIEKQLKARGDWLAAQAWRDYLDATCTWAQPCLRCLWLQLSCELPEPNTGDEDHEPDPEEEAFWREQEQFERERTQQENDHSLDDLFR